MEVPVAPPTAFLVTCGPGDALAAPAAARPRDEAIAADAATTQSPLVKRLRMVVPSCGLLGRPPSRWHGRSRSAGRRLVDVGCYSLLSRPVSQWSSPYHG